MQLEKNTFLLENEHGGFCANWSVYRNVFCLEWFALISLSRKRIQTQVILEQK